MEAFSLLKYWKGNRAGDRVRVSGAGGVAGPTHFPVASGGGRKTTILAAVADHAGDFDSDPDEGPFFDLEFAVPADEDVIRKLESENSESIDEEGEEDEEDEGEEEIEELRQSPSTSSSEHNASLSPSDEMLFKGRIIHIDGTGDEEVNSKSGQFQMPASILRSATKFRVMMLKLKRSKSELTKSSTKSQQPKQNQVQNNRKLFTVKFKVEEVPVISLLSRASSNSKSTTTAAGEEQPATAALDSGEEIRNVKKEVMQKYLKLVKPLYIRVSKRSNHQKAADDTSEEVKEEIDPAAETAITPAAEKSEVKAQKAVVGLNLKGMMLAKKHLGKSKSAVVHSHSQSLIQNLSSKKSDDSLLQQQDWIQGAILHCKRSFNSATQDLDVEEEKEDGSMLTRSASDPSHEKKRTTTEVKQNDVVGM